MKRFYKLSSLTAVLFTALFLNLFSDTTAYADTSAVNSFACANVEGIPSAECEVLVTLFNNTKGTSWVNKEGWLQNNMPCTWHGIQCRENRVSAIRLEGNNLEGTIPPELGQLSQLTSLSFHRNELRGPIPAQLGDLSQLYWLSLRYNQLSESIPPALGNLSRLNVLQLSGNELTGPIPTRLGDLSELSHLALESNKLTGPIPTELANLQRLRVMHLNSNQLSGNIPPELGRLSELISLRLSGNLSGPIPLELGSLNNLTNLSISGNQLSGSIPSELGRLSNLTQLFIYSKDLTGTIPPALGNLSSLVYLAIAGSQINGSIPSELSKLSNLTDLRLTGNQLSGSIPSAFGKLTKLEYLYLYGNQLSGSIPSELGDLNNLKGLNLNNNKLSGSIPPALGNLSNLTGLDLQQNNLTGSIPTTFGQLHNLDYLNVFLNQLEGSIPEGLGQLTKLRRLFLHANRFSGPLPDTFANLTALNQFYFYSTQLCEPDSLTTWLENIENKRGTEPCKSGSIYVSSSTGGRVGSLRFRDEDILVFDASTNGWSLYFDGSRVGLGRADVNAFHILEDGNILLSLNRPMTLDGVRYDDSDIILFAVDNIGPRTAGTFSRYFDGSDVLLTTGHEDIDAIGFTPEGDLVISTLGKANVGFVAHDEDLLRFEASSLGDNTAGVWHRYFDGSDVGLTTSGEDISGVWIDDETGELHLSALRHYSVESNGATNVSGDEDDVFICDPISLGADTNCVFTRFWDGDEHGYGGERIDGYAIGPDPASLFLTAASYNGIDGDPGINDADNEPDLNEHQDDDVLEEEDIKARIYLPLINQ